MQCSKYSLKLKDNGFLMNTMLFTLHCSKEVQGDHVKRVKLII